MTIPSKHPPEPTGPEINVDKVAFIIMAAREVEAPDEADGDASNPIDDGFTSTLDERGENAGRRELVDAIVSLDEEEQVELVALAWTGRGDFEPAEWADAVKQARERREGSTVRYLAGMETLAENLDEGLARFNLSYTS
jgi:hypothetical protein